MTGTVTVTVAVAVAVAVAVVGAVAVKAAGRGGINDAGEVVWACPHINHARVDRDLQRIRDKARRAVRPKLNIGFPV